MTQRKHLYPCRTQKLSSKVPKILVGFPAGKIGHRQILFYIPQQLSWQSARLLTVMSQVRALLEEPKQKKSRFSTLFCFTIKENLKYVQKVNSRLLTAEKVSAASGRKSELLKVQKLLFRTLRSKEETISFKLWMSQNNFIKY